VAWDEGLITPIWLVRQAPHYVCGRPVKCEHVSVNIGAWLLPPRNLYFPTYFSGMVGFDNLLSNTPLRVVI